jgi:hypothetical protein
VIVAVLGSRPPLSYQRPDSVVRRDPVIEYLEWLMERAVPVGRWSFGLDGILGLIPGIGDVLSGIIASYIIARAARAGVPKAALARMMTNVAIDTLLGSVPIIGDLFDFLYKSNTKNLRIFQESLGGREEPVKDWGVVILFVLGALILLAIPLVVAALLLNRVLRGV